MPAYNPLLTTSLGVGQQKILFAAGETGTTSTIAVAVGRDAVQPDIVTVFNSTDQAAPITIAAQDVDAQYLPFSQVDAGKAAVIQCAGSFIRAEFATAPTTGILIVLR